MRKKTLLFLYFFLSVSLIHTSFVYAQDYFVGPTGQDSANGSVQQPFRSIQHAIDQAKAGDTIFVRAGTYYELLKVSDVYATKNKPVIITSYNSEPVIIDGSKRDLHSSRRAGFVIDDSHYVHINGFEIRNITTDDEDFYPGGILVRGNSKGIKLTYNNIHHIANYNEEGNAHGINVYGNEATPIEDIVIQHNKLHHLTLGSSESLTITGNVTNFLIDQNILYNNNNIGIDIAGHYNACTEPGCIDIARNGIISNNQVINQSSALNIAYQGSDSAPGIYVDGGQQIQILNNYVASNNYGISIASEEPGKDARNILVEGNYISQNKKAGLVIGGSDTDNGGAYNVTVRNNVFYHNDTVQEGYREITLQQNNSKLQFENNKYYTCSARGYLNNVSDTTISLTAKGEKIRPLRVLCDENNYISNLWR